MATVKYDVGDILTWSNDSDCYMTAVIVRWHTKSIFVEGISLERQTDYDVFIKAKGDDFRFIHEAPEIVFFNYKVVGHIDISGMPNDIVKNNLICATDFAIDEEMIPYAIVDHWAILKTNIPKMTDKNCCYDGRDKLEKENKRLKEEIGSQNDKIFALQKELNRRRDEEVLISKNLHKLGFTSGAVYKIMYSELTDI